MSVKTVLFCLGSREELIELKDCISALTHHGHEVYILYEFEPIPLLNTLGARVYAEELPPIPLFKRFRFDMLIVGHQSEVGKKLVAQASNVLYRFLYQGSQTEAGEWLDLHEHLFMIWGLNVNMIRDWDQLAHNPWITNGKGDPTNFSDRVQHYLGED